MEMSKSKLCGVKGRLSLGYRRKLLDTNDVEKQAEKVALNSAISLEPETVARRQNLIKNSQHRPCLVTCSLTGIRIIHDSRTLRVQVLVIVKFLAVKR